MAEFPQRRSQRLLAKQRQSYQVCGDAFTNEEQMTLSTVRTLNQILAIHGSSLPMYLSSAPPHLQYGDEKVWECLRNVIDDQKTMIDKLADYVEELGGTPNHGEFPMDFTGMHDLSVEHIRQNVAERQRCELDWMEQLSESLNDATARALAQEAIGAAKAHLESLDECASTPA